MDHNKKKAFTLIELLVVIAIIALLLAILMPALEMVKKRGQAVVCLANVKQWGLIFFMYGDDNNGSFPQNFPGDGMTTFDSYWCHATMSYYENEKLRFCPSAKRNPAAVADVASGGGSMVYGDTYMNWGPFAAENSATPSDWWDEFPEGSYGMNEWCSNPPSDTTLIWGSPVKLTWRKINNVAQGGNNTPLFLDCRLVDGYPLDTSDPPEVPDEDCDYFDYIQDPMKMFSIDRHQKGITAVFVDGTARKVGLKELWTLKWHKTYNTKGEWTKAGGVTFSDWPDWMSTFKDF